jgi:peptide/nickel transport system permease protein
MRPVLLWSDALLFLLLALVFAGAWWSRRQEHLKDAWRKVGASGVAMAAATVLTVFLVMWVLD